MKPAIFTVRVPADHLTPEAPGWRWLRMEVPSALKIFADAHNVTLGHGDNWLTYWDGGDMVTCYGPAEKALHAEAG